MQTDLEDTRDLMQMREEMSNLVVGAMKEAEEFQDSFERYSYLWVDDLQESMKNFLAYGRTVTQEDVDARAEDVASRTPPTLMRFQQQVPGRPPLAPSPPSPPSPGRGAGFASGPGVTAEASGAGGGCRRKSL